MNTHIFFTYIILYFSALLPIRLEAASQYNKIGSCGSAKVVSGDTCSNVKVEFDLNDCKNLKNSQLATKIICKKNTIKARYQIENIRYEAQFQKKSDDWGGTTWKSLGPVYEYEKIQKLSNNQTPSIIERDLAGVAQPVKLLPAITATPSPSAQESYFKFSGFVDLRFSNFSTHNNPHIKSGNPESGFGFEDGALYSNYKKDKIAVIFDFSMRRSKEMDIEPNSSEPNQSLNSNFAIGHDKSQLYLKDDLGAGFFINFGQFDTPYGVELNDSKDRIFGKIGLVFQYLLPTTHTGIMIDYLNNGFSVKGLAANPNNKESFGTSTYGDDKTEYGTILAYSNELFHGQIGYLSRPINKASGTGSGDRSLKDFMIGATFNSFSLDLEYCLVNDPSKNTLTPDDSTDLEKPADGFLALASYKLSDSSLIGIRYELVKNDPAFLDEKTSNSIGASLHYKVTSELELRTEYVNYNSTDINDFSWKESRFNIATLIVF